MKRKSIYIVMISALFLIVAIISAKSIIGLISDGGSIPGAKKMQCINNEGVDKELLSLISAEYGDISQEKITMYKTSFANEVKEDVLIGLDVNVFKYVLFYKSNNKWSEVELLTGMPYYSFTGVEEINILNTVTSQIVIKYDWNGNNRWGKRIEFYAWNNKTNKATNIFGYDVKYEYNGGATDVRAYIKTKSIRLIEDPGKPSRIKVLVTERDSNGKVVQTRNEDYIFDLNKYEYAQEEAKK